MATIIKLTCKNCNKEFEVRKGKEKQTCSSECRWELRKKEDEKFYITKPCEFCGNNFKSKKKENKKYCSYKCSGLAKKKEASVMRICKQCGCEFQERKKYSREFCSGECRLNWNGLKENLDRRLKLSKEAVEKKYGVDSVFKLPSFQKKIHKIIKPNTEKAQKTLKENRNKKLILRFNEIGYNILEFNDDELKVRHPDGHIFVADRKLLVNRLNHNTELSTKLLPISAPRSTLELFVTNILDEYDINYKTNDRELLNGAEIDIIIPDHKIAIELNGLFWHSEYYVDKEYHLNKTKKCDQLNYELLHFFEDEIIEKPDIVKSMILNRLDLADRKLYGRNCVIKEVSSENSKKFLNENHIQGNVNSKIKIGLYYNDELVSLMTFGKKRKVLGSKHNDDEYELLRFCNKLNTTIIGGASKLLKFFEKTYNPKEIISYANRRYSKGNLYTRLNMEYIGETPPNYFYVINKIRKHRFSFRKDILIKEGYDSSKTEHEIMLDRKIPRIYDCGNLKYKKTLK